MRQVHVSLPEQKQNKPSWLDPLMEGRILSGSFLLSSRRFESWWQCQAQALDIGV